jgi:hypothetical protein
LKIYQTTTKKDHPVAVYTMTERTEPNGKARPSILSNSTLKRMTYPAASYGVSNVMPALISLPRKAVVRGHPVNTYGFRPTPE